MRLQPRPTCTPISPSSISTADLRPRPAGSVRRQQRFNSVHAGSNGSMTVGLRAPPREPAGGLAGCSTPATAFSSRPSVFPQTPAAAAPSAAPAHFATLAHFSVFAVLLDAFPGPGRRPVRRCRALGCGGSRDASAGHRSRCARRDRRAVRSTVSPRRAGRTGAGRRCAGVVIARRRGDAPGRCRSGSTNEAKRDGGDHTRVMYSRASSRHRGSLGTALAHRALLAEAGAPHRRYAPSGWSSHRRRTCALSCSNGSRCANRCAW